MEEKKVQNAPKKKFSFKRKQATKSSVANEKQKEETKEPEKQVVSKKIEIQEGNSEHQILNENDKNILIQKNEKVFVDNELISDSKTLDSEFVVKNCSNCTITLQGTMKTLKLLELQSCIIYAGPVARSIMVDHCKECTIQIASHQMRIHNSNKCHFFLCSNSKPIIEDCNELKFSCYSYSYDDIDTDFTNTNLHKDDNKWREIQDFNWLKTNTPSPNFTIIE